MSICLQNVHIPYVQEFAEWASTLDFGNVGRWHKDLALCIYKMGICFRMGVVVGVRYQIECKALGSRVRRMGICHRLRNYLQWARGLGS